MTPDLRDYDAWHTGYDDPGSTLSWRLNRVQAGIGRALDAAADPVHVVSACAGDGRDVLGVLARRGDASRVRATLLELHPVVAERARQAAAAAGLTAQVEVRTMDAGRSDAYRDLSPADIVLLVGVFGNIDVEDLQRTVAASPQLCAPGATLIWTRGRGGELADRNHDIRSWFRAAGLSRRDTPRSSAGANRRSGLPVTTARR